MSITTIARRIVRIVNAAHKRGSTSGFLLFSREDGSGGAYYTDNARPNMTGNVAISLGRRLTASDVQEILDNTDPARRE